MEIEADAPQDAPSGLDLIADFASPPEHETAARNAVLYAYLGDAHEAKGAPGGTRGAAASESARFPGPNPISMDPEFLSEVMRQPYVCSPKVDGTRFQIVGVRLRSGERAVVLVDRRMACYTTTYASVPELTFEGRGTVLDAELVGSRLYIFDAVMISGKRSISQESYPRRLEAAGIWAGAGSSSSGPPSLRSEANLPPSLRSEANLPPSLRSEANLSSQAGCSAEIGFGDDVLLSIHMKPIFPASLSRRVLLEPSSLGFRERTDGLVLTPANAPVQLFTAWKIFKVKPYHTLDFRLVLVPTRQLKAYLHPILSVPEAISQRMRNPILQNAMRGAGPVSGPARTAGDSAGAASASRFASERSEGGRAESRTPSATVHETLPRTQLAAAGSLLQFSAKGKKRARAIVEGHVALHGAPAAAAAPAGPAGPAAPIPPADPAPDPVAAAAAAAPSAPARERVQWILRLEYTHGMDAIDATRQGIEYDGHRLVLRIREDDTLTWLLDEIETVWRGMQGDVVAMSLIVECKLHVPRDFRRQGEEEVVCDVEIERPRPDKHEPNNSLTITRTLTTILHGVTAEDLAVLER